MAIPRVVWQGTPTLRLTSVNWIGLRDITATVRLVDIGSPILDIEQLGHDLVGGQQWRRGAPSGDFYLEVLLSHIVLSQFQPSTKDTAQ